MITRRLPTGHRDLVLTGPDMKRLSSGCEDFGYSGVIITIVVCYKIIFYVRMILHKNKVHSGAKRHQLHSR